MTSIPLAYLLLARIVVGEAGFSATEDDVMAHHSVLTSRTERRGWSYVQAAQLYSPRHTGVKESRRPWIAELNKALRRPPSFPENLPWSNYKPNWKRILELAGKAHRGELEQRCVADHWGSPNHPIDKKRIKRATENDRQIIVDCGDTKNVFLRINDNFHNDKLKSLKLSDIIDPNSNE